MRKFARDRRTVQSAIGNDPQTRIHRGRPSPEGGKKSTLEKEAPIPARPCRRTAGCALLLQFGLHWCLRVEDTHDHATFGIEKDSLADLLHKQNMARPKCTSSEAGYGATYVRALLAPLAVVSDWYGVASWCRLRQPPIECDSAWSDEQRGMTCNGPGA